MKAKPWQVALIAVSLLAAAASTIYTLMTGDPVRPVTHVFLIDVESGKIYKADIRKSLTIPARRPDGNRERALLRLDVDDSGRYYVNRRDRDSIGALDPEVEVKAINPSSGELLNPFNGRGAETYRPPT
ncbi:MAG: hypothetical protein ACK4WH_13925 [Phycisphaerales bacterium]